jgi:hypothetical protein
MEAMAQSFDTVEQAPQELKTDKTTLYELIEAISDQVQPEEDLLVVEAVLDLIDTGQIKFPGSMGEAVSPDDHYLH